MKFDPVQLEDEEPKINLTSMVDVVFTLLSFFVLTVVFGNERDVPAGSDSPTAPSVAAQSGDLPERIVIRLAPAGEGVVVTIGQVVMTGDSFAGITAKLGEINLPNTPVVIASDRLVTVEHVARAMEAVLASPMKKVTLSELSSGGSNPLPPREGQGVGGER